MNNLNTMKTTRKLQKIGGERDLTEKDLADFERAEKNIFYLMADRGWHKATAIIEASGQREGLRRLRQLRERGFTVEKRRDGSGRDFSYRLGI